MLLSRNRRVCARRVRPWGTRNPVGHMGNKSVDALGLSALSHELNCLTALSRSIVQMNRRRELGWGLTRTSVEELGSPPDPRLHHSKFPAICALRRGLTLFLSPRLRWGFRR